MIRSSEISQAASNFPSERLKILICTGIYPPAVGGPAQYAKELENELKRRGNEVDVLAYGFEYKLPTLARHLWFFWRVLLQAYKVDFILVLDTFSVGWPSTAAAMILGKKIIVRTGGDFLWESYVERTEELVLFRDFYNLPRQNLSWKEKKIFRLTKWVLQNVNAVIFSTEWQRKIFEGAYELNPNKNFIVENFYGEKIFSGPKQNRDFVGGTRPLRWKNVQMLRSAFLLAKEADPTIALDVENAPYEQFLEKIRTSYAVILVSLGDISPNMILDAIRTNTPFILTKENGIYERVKDIGLFVDPKDKNDIKEKILYLADRTNYKFVAERIEAFNFTHTWAQMCDEILAVAKAVNGAKV